ncbi:hypothetical protein E2C01_001641 [Portunus trituberculatus]|uniref:Uncharacterized protein n=1 Tax=Portunus trituberculatus TaxID=210409 RepID=A0A5B7CI53_PORTR|nr:hypothetical protein [Portunus trituberculatus]
MDKSLRGWRTFNSHKPQQGNAHLPCGRKAQRANTCCRGDGKTALWSGSEDTRAMADCRHVAGARPLFPGCCFRAQGTPVR